MITMYFKPEPKPKLWRMAAWTLVYAAFIAFGYYYNAVLH